MQCLHQHPHFRAQEAMWKRRQKVRKIKWGWKTPSQRLSSRHNRTNAHMNSQVLWQHTQDLHRSKTNGSQCWEGTKLEATSNRQPLSKEKFVFSNGISLNIQTTLKGCPVTNSRRPRQIELNDIFWKSFGHNAFLLFLTLLVCCLFIVVSDFVFFVGFMWTHVWGSMCFSCFFFFCFLLLCFILVCLLACLFSKDRGRKKAWSWMSGEVERTGRR